MQSEKQIQEGSESLSSTEVRQTLSYVSEKISKKKQNVKSDKEKISSVQNHLPSLDRS